MKVVSTTPSLLRLTHLCHRTLSFYTKILWIINVSENSWVKISTILTLRSDFKVTVIKPSTLSPPFSVKV